jgi:hypothetical protein
VHLGNGAIDPPACAHLSPMQDELLRGISQDHLFIISVISVLTEMTDECDAQSFAMQRRIP